MTQRNNYLIILQCLFSTSSTAKGRKKVFYLLLTHFALSRSLHTKDRKEILGLYSYLFLSKQYSVFSRTTFYVKPMYCFYTISVKPYSFQQPVSCRETKSHSFISKFCFTLALYHELHELCIMKLQVFFCSSHTLYKHGYMVPLTTNENYRNADSAIQATQL